MRISDWKDIHKNTLQAVFTLTLDSGLVVHGCMLHERGGSKWIGLPTKEYVDCDGTRQFARIIGFTDRAAADTFKDDVLAVIDKMRRAA
jgi:DNA-binding cell septation regulator SpoVG